MDFTPEQMEHAQNMSIDELLCIGNKLDALNDISQKMKYELVNDEINTLCILVLKFVSTDEKPVKREIERMHRLSNYLSKRFDYVYHDESATNIAREIISIMKGEATA